MTARLRNSSLTLMFLAALAGTGCREHHPPPAEAPRPAQVVRVIAVQPESRILMDEVAGTIRPKLSAVVAAKVSGTIESVLVTPGSRVKTGDLLAEIDARETRARLIQARAARDQAVQDYARLKQLLASRAVSQQEFDAADSRMKSSSGLVEEVEAMLGYSRVTAPFDGVVARKRVEAGDLATPGRPLFDVEAPGELRVEADVPEALIGGMKKGDRLGVKVATSTNALTGTVSEIAPVADPGSRTFLVKLDLADPGELRSGQFARLLVPTSMTEVLSVPASALVIRGQMELVYVVTAGHAQMRLVRSGKRYGTAVEIISGLAGGEQVVIEGAQALVDGQAVEIKP